MTETLQDYSAHPLHLGGFDRNKQGSRSKEERDQERIERLTVAAFELFSTRGYHNTPIELLCSQANVSTRDFYKLGKTREKLMVRVYRRVALYVEARVLQALAGSSLEDSMDRVNCAVDAWVAAYTGDSRYARLSYLEAVGISDDLEQIRAEAHARFAGLIREEMRRMYPDFNPASQEGKLPIAIVGACNELTREWLSRQPDAPAEDLAEEIKLLYSVIFRGIGLARAT